MENILSEILGYENVFKNEPMSLHTSFKTGGIADFFVLVDSVEKLQKLLSFIKEKNINYYIIGLGTNTLVTDKGFRGVIIQLRFDQLKIEKLEDYSILTIGAGYPLPKLKKTVVDNELGGFESIVGIPGSVGGAIKMNAGAYGTEIKDLLTETKVLDDNNNIISLNNLDQKFEYRKSIYFEKNYIILEAKMKAFYKDKNEIKKIIEELTIERRSKQPLEYPSAGSTFKRGEDFVTAQLIDKCGLKGFSVGGAEVSEKHAGFIINKNNATSDDIIKLIEIVKQKVFEKFDKKIELEIEVIGE